jgi:hypothetical protein
MRSSIKKLSSLERDYGEVYGGGEGSVGGPGMDGRAGAAQVSAEIRAADAIEEFIAAIDRLATSDLNGAALAKIKAPLVGLNA